MSPFDLTGIPSNFSCDPHRFISGAATVTAPSSEVTGTIAAGPTDPAVVTLGSGVPVGATLTGTGRFLSGGDRHAVRIGVNLGVDDRFPEDRRESRDAACADADGVANSSAGSTPLSAAAQCSVGAMDIDASSIKKENVGGQQVITEFEAEVVSELYVVMDHGSASQGKNISRGAIYTMTVRSRYRFEAVNDTVEFSSTSPSQVNPLEAEATATNFQASVNYSLESAAMGRVVLKLFGRNGAAVEELITPLFEDVTEGSGSVDFDVTPFIVPTEGEVVMVAELVDDAGKVLDTTQEVIWQVADLKLTIDRMEVVQVVQNVDNTVPLIVAKPTAVRVFTKSLNGKDENNVKVQLVARRGGRQVGMAQFRTQRGFANPVREVRQHSHNFTLPPGWTAAGAIELVATVNPDDNPPEADRTDNEKSITLDFQESRALRVRWVNICFESGGNRLCPGGGPSDPAYFLRRLYPVSDDLVTMTPVGIPDWTYPFGSLGFGSALLHNLQRAYWILVGGNRFGENGFDQLVGWVPDAIDHNAGGMASDLFSIEPRAAWVIDYGSDGRFTSYNVAHEIGHNQEIDHTGYFQGCGAVSLGPLSDWPFSTSNTQEHGFDPRDGSLKIGKPVGARGIHFDLMSYCKPTWISEHYYRRLIGNFRKAPLRIEQGAPQTVGLFSGTVGRDGGEATLDALFEFETTLATSKNNPAGGNCLVLSGDAGELSRHCFDLQPGFGENGIELPFSDFTQVLPLPAGFSRFALVQNGVELAASNKSANPPTVEITSPAAGAVWDAAVPQTVMWTATDPDGDSLRFVFSYSANGGATWLPLELETTATRHTFNAGHIEGGADVRFRVVALDGFNQSEAQVGPVEVVQRPGIAAADPAVLGSLAAGLTARRSVALRNPGSGPLQIVSIAVDNPLFEITAPLLPATVRAGEELDLSVRFRSEEVGPQQAEVAVESNAADEPSFSFRIQMEVDDGQTPRLESDADSLQFSAAPIGDTRVSALELWNSSAVDVSGSLSVSGEGFSLGDTASPFTLGSGERLVASVTFQPEREGAFAGDLRVESNSGVEPVKIVALRGSAFEMQGAGGPTAPQVSAGGVVDAAQFAATLSRGGLGSIFGQNLADANAGAAGLPLPADLGGVRVRVNGVDAPLLFVSPGQINFQMPFEAPLDGVVEIVVVRNGEASAPVSATVAPYAPALFLSNGEPIIQRHPDLDLISASNPARPGDVLIIFMTGIGDLNNVPASGAGAPGSPPATAKILPTATIGGVDAPVLFAGLAPGFVGLGQVNITVPETLAAPLSEEGSVGQASGLPLALDFNGATNPAVNIAVDIGGVPQPRMVVSPSSLDFGEVGVGESKDLAVTISNTGAVDLVIGQPAINDPQFQLVGVLSLVIAPGGQQLATVRFTPGSGGAKSASMTIAGNDPANLMIVVSLSGKGAADAGPEDLQVSPSPIEFGAVNIGSSAAQTVTISNVGGQSLRVGLIRATDAQFRVEFPDKTPPVDLSPGASFFVRVLFEPASVGLTESALLVSSQNFGNNITLRGAGVSSDAPSISIPSPLPFGPVPVGRVAEKTISVSNNGTASLVVSAVTSDDPQFVLGDVELPFTVLPGQQQAVQIHYAPAAVGSHEATLQFESNDPGQANAPLMVVGQGTVGVPVIFSDSFERPDGVNCAVGSADHALGGSGFHGYAMIASGARLRGGLLENAAREYGGVSFTNQSGGSCPGEGSDQGADLNIRADVLVPRAAARTTQAGPFFHAPLLGSGERIDQGGAAGYWVQLDSSGEVRVQRLDTFQRVAVSDAPADFDASVMHTIEVAVRGQSAEVTVDGRLRLFRQGAGVGGRSTVNVVPTAGSNEGGAGLAFGAVDGPASPGGQQLDNIRVSGYETLLGAPVERTP